MDGARREAKAQAQAQLEQTAALYAERAATLEAENESIALYPAVIAAVKDHNAQPLKRWSSDMAALQQKRMTMVDAGGMVIVRGHDPARAGDALAPALEGLRLALAGQATSGVEDGDELGPALRGYAPVRANGRQGSVVGAVMVAEPLDAALLPRLAGPAGQAAGVMLRVEPPGPAPAAPCLAGSVAAATCRLSLAGPGGQPAATLTLTVPLASVEQALAAARRGVWLVGAMVLAGGAL